MNYRSAIIKITELAREDGTHYLVDLADALMEAYTAGRASALDGMETVANETLIREMRADHERMNFIRVAYTPQVDGFVVDRLGPKGAGVSIDDWLDAAIEEKGK